MHTGTDFTEAGFNTMIEWLYTGAAVGVTHGVTNAPLTAAALQAAEFFGLPTYRDAISAHAAACGQSVPTPMDTTE